jgi:hypothetical protein
MNTMARKHGRPEKTAKSATRAISLRGRKPTGKKAPRRATNADIVRKSTPQPDPTLKRLPRDRFNVVFRRKTEVPVNQLKGVALNIICADCQQRLAIDAELQKAAESKPERESRAMRYICRQCYWRYYEGFEDSLKAVR